MDVDITVGIKYTPRKMAKPFSFRFKSTAITSASGIIKISFSTAIFKGNPYAVPEKAVREHALKVGKPCVGSRKAIVIITHIAENPDKRIDGAYRQHQNCRQQHQHVGTGLSLAALFFVLLFHIVILLLQETIQGNRVF